LEAGENIIYGLWIIEILIEMIYVSVIVIKNIRSVVVGMDSSQGFYG